MRTSVRCKKHGYREGGAFGPVYEPGRHEPAAYRTSADGPNSRGSSVGERFEHCVHREVQKRRDAVFLAEPGDRALMVLQFEPTASEQIPVHRARVVPGYAIADFQDIVDYAGAHGHAFSLCDGDPLKDQAPGELTSFRAS